MGSKVLKFGGSSVGTSARVAGVLDIVTAESLEAHTRVRAVVVSAFQGVTDGLIALAHEAARGSAQRDQTYETGLAELERRHLSVVEDLIPPVNRSSSTARCKVLLNELGEVLRGVQLVKECTPRTLDLVMSFGERLSATILAEVGRSRGMDVEFVDARHLVRTNAQFGHAVVDRNVTDKQIIDFFAHLRPIAIITGFIGSTEQEIPTTLGRGGSDYSASLFGAALDVDVVEIWTDVDGMLTADPRKVPKAFPIAQVTFEEAMELCHFGAKVIYPPTIQPAIDAQIPLVIKNTLNPTAPGTRISAEASEHGFPITGISSISRIALLRIQGAGMFGVAGVAMRFFGALARRRINIILITQASSEHTICCAIDPIVRNEAEAAIGEEFALEMKAGLIAPLIIEEELSIVSVVGERMRHTPGVAGRVFHALGMNGINVVAIAQGSSELNISAVVGAHDEAKALIALHDEFFLAGSKTIHLWLVGTGLIGRTLARQIQERREALQNDLGLDIQIRGLTNSRVMRFASNGSSVDTQLPLNDSDTPLCLKTFICNLIDAHLPNSIFVDCTAGDDVPQHYARILENSIAVVTPNKKGFSAALAEYSKLKDTARRRRVPLLNETCVGAALPVLGTLSDLVRSGDQVIKIDAVLSGTLSFIFNSLSAEKPFSVAVNEARERGLTEPDPRDDLSGMDVARKVLILAREGGLPLESGDIELPNILPTGAEAWTREEFLERLPQLDAHFESLRSEATLDGKRLFFAATIDFVEKRAQLALQSYDARHPFNALDGSDNVVAFTTKRYNDRPLVVKGPGAGAEVTAAGVFADILRAAGR